MELAALICCTAALNERNPNELNDGEITYVSQGDSFWGGCALKLSHKHESRTETCLNLFSQ